MTDKTEKVAGDPETIFKRPRESDSPSYQKRQKMALLARKQGAGDGLTGGSAMSKEKKLKSGDGIPPSQFYQIDEFTGFSKDGLMQKRGRNATVGGIITSNFSGDDLKVTEILLSSESQEKINADIKCQLVKEIQHFGQIYEKIFKLLDGLQGPIEVKKQFFESIIKEAARYMRGDLIQNLEKKLEEMIWGYLYKKEPHTLNA
ncbi:cancer/testis antigen family 45 member A10-like [Sapajus apella]|uniref:Cancer/testis antigen family 45 member A10-like n=1 Tax=Sapajus apella TaxID=9515 RepID=A0A6J3GPV1_SAPAP|nr:cancer/testis antigen family 45 member A10-like [Sapajus apella]